MAEVCVIYNPCAGRNHAEQRLCRLRRLLGARAEFRPTAAPGHAEELAASAAAVTSTTSVIAPTSNSTLRVTVSFTGNATLFRIRTLKPVSSTRTLYVPGWSCETR